MKVGFALIDLLVSIMISSIMSTVLFTMIFQIQKSENMIDEVVGISMQAALARERLQKDFTGLFWPQFMSEKSPVKSDQIKNQVKSTKVGGVDYYPLSASGQKKQQLSAGLQIAKILYSQNIRYGDVEILKECSFITCNPLQVYNESKPRIARVIYTLVPEQASSDSFELQRKEGTALDYQTVQAEAQPFVVVSGVKNFKITYFYQKTSQPKDDFDINHLIKKDELNYDETGENFEASESTNLAGQVPSYVQVNIALWDDINHKDFQEFEFWFYINAPFKNSLEKQKNDTK